MAECDGPNCTAEVVWAETTDGRRQPFDRVPTEDGNRYLLGRGPNRPPLAVAVSAIDEGGYDLRECRYMPHHATCVDVERFR